MGRSSVIPLAIILGGVIIAGAVYFSISKQEPSSAAHGNPYLVLSVTSADHILGNPAAPVTIVEYADFESEYCKAFHETLHQIIANEGAAGKVAWVLREFPLTELNPNSLSHARAAECAAKVGGNAGFWSFADLLFANQPANPLRYGELARAAGIQGDAFASCYANASATFDARIMADRQNALDAGASGAPYALILAAGKAPIVIDGAYPYDAVRTLVRNALGQ